MSAILEALVAGQVMLEDDIGATITWAGASYPCSAGPEFGGKKIDEGGFRMQAAVKIRVRIELFLSGRPQEKQTVMFSAKAGATARKYRIDSITNQHETLLVLECNDPAQGA
jgi:hypothetical protein